MLSSFDNLVLLTASPTISAEGLTAVNNTLNSTIIKDKLDNDTKKYVLRILKNSLHHKNNSETSLITGYSAIKNMAKKAVIQSDSVLFPTEQALKIIKGTLAHPKQTNKSAQYAYAAFCAVQAVSAQELNKINDLDLLTTDDCTAMQALCENAIQAERIKKQHALISQVVLSEKQNQG